MAASASLHSFLASPVTHESYRGNVIFALPSSYRSCGWRNSSTHRVRCMAEDPKQNQPAAPSTETSSPSPPPKPVNSKVSTRIFDVLAFSGPGPERINGRLAMVGFVGAIVAEVLRGEDLVAQLADGGVAWFVGTSVVLTLASLVPLLRGVSAESKSEGLMTSDAELWNGRFAMLGLVALLFTEYVKGGALV